MPSPSATPNVLAGITYVHSLRYFEKGIDGQGPFYDVEYQIDDWADSDAFINALMGVSAYSGGGSFYTGPHRHPLSSNLICTSARCVGRGMEVLDSEHGYPSYVDGAIIRAQYRSPVVGSNGGGGIINAFDDPGFRHQIEPTQPILWCTQELDFGIETLTLNAHDWIYETSTLPIPTPMQIDQPITTMILTYHQLPYLPVTKIRAARGKINSEPFLGCPVGTVLFQGARTTREWSTSGRVTQKVQLTFVEREENWNKVIESNLSAAAGGKLVYAFAKAKSAPSGQGRRFQTYDLRLLTHL
jgi:hypothetical protein